MKLLKRLLYGSFKDRVVLAIIVGFFSKFITVPAFFLYYFITKLGIAHSTTIDTPTSVGASFVTLNFPFDKLVSILVLAPIIENLIIPLFFWIFGKLKYSSLISIVAITTIAFFYHEPGSSRITGAMFFLTYSVFYMYCIRVCGKAQSYILSVISHFITNLIAVGFMLAFS